MARDRAGRPEAKPLRLFVALVPPPAAIDAVERAAAPWRDRWAGARWERPEKMHFTLRFLGRTFPRLVAWVEESCRSVAGATEPFTVRLQGFGAFPSPGRARVLWVGVGDGGDRLVTLAGAIDSSLAGELEPERRPFTPHLTVARFRAPVSLRGDIEELRATGLEAPAFVADRLTLVRSHLQGPKGSRYEVLAELPLGGAG